MTMAVTQRVMKIVCASLLVLAMLPTFTGAGKTPKKNDTAKRNKLLTDRQLEQVREESKMTYAGYGTQRKQHMIEAIQKMEEEKAACMIKNMYYDPEIDGCVSCSRCKRGEACYTQCSEYFLWQDLSPYLTAALLAIIILLVAVTVLGCLYINQAEKSAKNKKAFEEYKKKEQEERCNKAASNDLAGDNHPSSIQSADSEPSGNAQTPATASNTAPNTTYQPTGNGTTAENAQDRSSDTAHPTEPARPANAIPTNAIHPADTQPRDAQPASTSSTLERPSSNRGERLYIGDCTRVYMESDNECDSGNDDTSPCSSQPLIPKQATSVV